MLVEYWQIELVVQLYVNSIVFIQFGGTLSGLLDVSVLKTHLLLIFLFLVNSTTTKHIII